MSKEIALKFESQLSKYYLQTIKDLLEEQEINPQQFMHMAVNQIKRNSRLLQVFTKNPASVFSSILTCAEFGLSPTAQMGECWLIPYGNECQFQIGYQGLSKLLYRNPNVQNITSECVYENDEFEYELGLTPTLSHKPTSVKRGALIAVYCVVRFSNQEPIFKVMNMDDLRAIQALSKAGNGSIWFSPKDPENWMLKKTCFKQLCKLLPKNLNMAKVIAYDNVVEGGGAMRLDDNNQPIVIETKPKTTASLFEKAMKEDEGATIEEQAEHTDWEGDIPGFEETMDDLKQIKVEFEPILPGLDPKVKSANIHLAEIKETKTTKKYTDKQMKKIVDNMKSIEKLKKNGKK
jgi:recombination protein RecT|tara:strand:- start:5109 stop:6152 length:1044 start_codon:yes stop_codon:yes gene_type:complete